LAWWLVLCLPFPGLPHIYFLFTVRLRIFHVCRNENFRNSYLSFYWKKWFDIWFWHGDLYCVFPFPGLLHIYFLFTVRLTNERVGVFLARRSVQHLVDITVIRQTDSTFDSPFYSPATKSRGGILIYPCPSVRPSRYRYMVCPAISSYSFGATALIFCRMFIPQDFDFHQIFSKWQVVGLSHFVRPSRYRYMVSPAISSYSFGATALIFRTMFIHIMEVDLFIISYGQVGASFVSYRHTSFFLNHS
jgi:hypothetical protein